MEGDGELKKQRRVLIAVDRSDESIYALSWALDCLLVHVNADKEQNDELILLHAQPPLKVFADSSAIDVFESMERCQRSITGDILEKAKAICSAKNISAATKVVVGDARDVICEQVEKLRADLLVVGSRGHGAIKRALLGSVSDYCIRHAKCPVVVVKRPKK